MIIYLTAVQAHVLYFWCYLHLQCEIDLQYLCHDENFFIACPDISHGVSDWEPKLTLTSSGLGKVDSYFRNVGK